SLEIYNRYLSGDAGNSRARYLRALTFAALGRYQKALEDATAAEQGGNRMDPALINQWRMKAGQR
ncbi:MAG: hypothetical protein ACE5DN_05345, partial [Flavobacteriales bacterium]